MNPERTVTLVIGRDQVARRPPPEARAAGLTASLAVVLSTWRSDSTDMVLDHPLWLGCARAVTEVTGADTTQVFGERRPRLLGRIQGKGKPPTLGSLETFAACLNEDPAAPEWDSVHWRQGGLLVAAGVAEPWYRIGGPALYHDAYAMRVFLPPDSIMDGIVACMRRRIEEAGGRLDRVVDLADPASV